MATTSPVLVFTPVDRDGRRSARGLRQSGIRYVLRSRVESLTGQAGVHAERAAADLLHEVASDVLRDRALLLLGFAGASRRGELTRLVWDDVRFVDEGMVVHLRRSKTDPLGRGTDIGIPWGRSSLTCPVRAVEAWRDRVREQLGEEFSGDTAMFVRVGRSGRISPEHPLSNEGLTMVVKRRAAAAGLEGQWGGRSLRAGLISTAADLDIPLELIARQSRHASLDSLMRYVRYEDPFRRNAVNVIGL
jgi:integrase